MRLLRVITGLVIFLSFIVRPPDPHSDPGVSRPEVKSYDVNLKVFPGQHVMRVRVEMDLACDQEHRATLAFRLLNAFKVITIKQGGRPLAYTQQAENKISVSAVQVGPHCPSLVWEYEGGVHTQPDGDYTSEVIMYDEEVRPAVHSAWYPQLQAARLARTPSSKLTIEVPKDYLVVAGDEMARPPQFKADRVVFCYASSGNGSLSFVAAPMKRISITRAGVEIEAFYWPAKPKRDLLEWHTPQDEVKIKEVLEEAGRIIEYYSTIFRPYPCKKFSLVQKGNYKGHAYGVKTFLVVNNINLNQISRKTLAHEIAHNWWGAQVQPVGDKSWWISESIAEYSAFLYLQHADGAREVIGDRDFQLRLRRTKPDYDNLAYHTGPLIHHILRYVMGERDFFNLLKRFTEEYDDRPASVADFRALAGKIHGQSLDWFFNAWLEHNGGPVYILDAKCEAQSTGEWLVRGRIIQEQTRYRMPLMIEVIGKGRTERKQIWVQDQETTLALRIRFKPTEVRFAGDMPYWILADFYNSPGERQAALKREKENPPLPSFSAKDVTAMQQELIARHRKYKVSEIALKPVSGAEVEFTLKDNQSMRLVMGDNPYQLKEILVGVWEGLEDERFVFSDGHVSGGGKYLRFGSNQGRQPNRFPFVIKTRWAIGGQQVKIHLSLEEHQIKR